MFSIEIAKLCHSYGSNSGRPASVQTTQMPKSATRHQKTKTPGQQDPSAGPALDRMAEEIFELSKLGWLLRTHRRRRHSDDLTETEFLTLDLLVNERTRTVGQLRKGLGILPAQMSRVLRGLERRPDKALIKCTINPRDRRKIDVVISDAGRKAHRLFRQARLSTAAETLSQLPQRDQREFMRILEKIRALLIPKIEPDA